MTTERAVDSMETGLYERFSPGVKIAINTAVVLCIPIAPFLWGVMVSQLWSWFMVPAFGLRPISWATAAGISLLGRVLTAPSPTVNDERDLFAKKMSTLGYCYLAPLFAYVLGWCIHLFV